MLTRRKPLVMTTFLVILIACSSEETEWKTARTQNTIGAYEDFVREYPDGEFLQAAQTRIEELSFEATKSQNTIEAYESFLAKYPEGKFTEPANIQIEKLSFESAASENTIAAYRDFLAKYPGGEFARAAQEQVEEVSFQEASNAGSIEAYRTFMETFPESKRSEEALAAIRKIEEETLFITTIPSGLKIYWARDQGLGPKSSSDGVSLIESHPLIDDKNLKGTSPLSIRNASPGKYLLGVSPLIILDEDFRISEVDEWLTATAFVSFSPLPINPARGLKGGLKGAAVYSIEKIRTPNQRSIILALSPGASMKLLDSSYPTAHTFSSDAKQCRREFEKVNYGEIEDVFGEMARIIDLLRRGKKVRLERGDVRFSAELEASGRCVLKISIRAR